MRCAQENRNVASMDALGNADIHCSVSCIFPEIKLGVMFVESRFLLSGHAFLNALSGLHQVMHS